MRLGRAALLLACLAGGGCASSPRDSVPATHDVTVTADAGAAGTDTYVHVARRLHGVVALAEARNMGDEDARAVVERIADDLERCTTSLEEKGLLVEGAARVVAVAGPNGTPALNVRFAPGDAVAQNALLCLVAPVRASTLPFSSGGGSRGPAGLAIEATWGPRVGRRPEPDAGGQL